MLCVMLCVILCVMLCANVVYIVILKSFTLSSFTMSNYVRVMSVTSSLCDYNLISIDSRI